MPTENSRTTVGGVLRGSAYALSVFKPQAIANLASKIYLKPGRPILSVSGAKI